MGTAEIEHGSERAAGDSGPLLGPRPLRALVVLALFGTGLGAVVVAVAATLLEVPGNGGGAVLGVALAALAATPFACWAFEIGRWSWNRSVAWFQIACAAVLAAAYLAGCLFCAARAADAISARAPYGATALEVVGWLAVTAGGLLLLALLLASVPLPPQARRHARWLPAAVATVAAAVGFMAAGTQVIASDCDAFAFDPERWRATLAGAASDRDAERLFAAVARCGTVDGLTRAETVELLGRPSSRVAGEWMWTGPEATGLFATAPVLDVTFEDGEVVAVSAEGGGD